MERKLNFIKNDKLGQELKPGNVCVRLVKHKYNSTIQFCIYKEDVNGSKSKGTYGRFLTPEGLRSLKYSSVVFVFEPSSKRLAVSPEITTMIKQYYEGVKNV